VESAAKAAGLSVVTTGEGRDFSGGRTVRFMLALASNPARTHLLELSAGFDFSGAPLQSAVESYLQETATRMKNPRPDCYVTLHGVPLSLGKFEWPIHGSTSGADTLIVPGEAWLEDSKETGLHAKIAAAITQTLGDVIFAPEQPLAEGMIFNAVRKMTDQGQIELVKSGNLQPVPVTTRYWSPKLKKFLFNDTTAEQRSEFLASKVYWLSGVLGGGEPVWLADPRDAQYLDTTVEDLKQTAQALAAEGLVQLAEDEFGKPTEVLMARKDHYEKVLADMLDFIKPSFNEQMRAGHTNM